MEENTSSTLTPAENIRQLTEKIQAEMPLVNLMNKEMSKVIVGQDKMLTRLLIALFANGHVLLEGVPGLAKTLAIKTLSDVVGGDFNRVQFTPDLLPADITGTQIYNQKTQTDRKSTRLNSSHVRISYAVFCLKKKKNKTLKTNYT